MRRKCFNNIKAVNVFIFVVYVFTVIFLFGDRDNALAVIPAYDYSDDYYFEGMLLVLCVSFSVHIVSYWISVHKKTVMASILVSVLNFVQAILLIVPQPYIYDKYIKMNAFDSYTYSFQLIGYGMAILFSILAILSVLNGILSISDIQRIVRDNRVIKDETESIVIGKVKETSIHIVGMFAPVVCLVFYDHPDMNDVQDTVCKLLISIFFVLYSMLVLKDWIVEEKYLYAIMGYLGYGLMTYGIIHCLYDEIYYTKEVNWRVSVMAIANLLISAITIGVLIRKLILKNMQRKLEG